jgi:hypothetical protein
MGHVIRGNFAQAVSMGAAMLWLGDSITNPYQVWSVAGTMYRRWPTPCLGGRTGNQNSGGSGWPLNVSQWNGSNVTHVQLRPGEIAPDGTSGFHLMMCGIGQVSGGDLANFGSPQALQISPETSAIPQWDTNKTVEVIVSARTEPLAANPDQWRFQFWDRANVLLGQVSPISFDQPTADRWWKSVGFPRGAGVFNVPARLSSFNEVETGALLKTNQYGVRVLNGGSGICWGYTGHGGWSIRNHSTQAGRTITNDGPAYTGRYDDSCAIADMQAYGWNVIAVWLGANDADLSKVAFRGELELLRTRYRALSTAASRPMPCFVFFTQYDLADANILQVEKAQAMEEMAAAYDDCECVDLRQEVFAALGPWSAFRAVDLPDTVHPSGTRIRNLMADRSWAILNGPTTHGNAKDRDRAVRGRALR